MKPTVGRIVLVRNKDWGQNEYPAIINKVWSDICINVMAFPDGPAPISISSIMLCEEFDESGWYCAWRWMPYQKAAAETEEHKRITAEIEK